MILWETRESFASASTRPPVDCRGGDGEAGKLLGTGVLGQKSRGSVAFGNPRFSDGKAY